MSYHKTNLGKFGESLPCDLDGYVHTSAKGWMDARMDGMTWRGYSHAEKYERCKEMAADARAALKESEAALAEWRKNNG